MEPSRQKLKQDVVKALNLAWDISCGKGWYDVEKSEEQLWDMLVEYGLQEGDSIDAIWNKAKQRKEIIEG